MAIGDPSERNRERARVQTSQDREVARLIAARAAVLADPVVRGAAALGLVWVLAYAAATGLVEDHAAARQVLGDLVYLVPVAVATGLAAVAARRASGRRRRLWRLLLVSNALWLLGDLTWAAYPYLLHAEAPFPSVADGLYLASYALVPAAVLFGFGAASRQRRARGLLDGAVVGLAIGALGWHLLIAPQLSYGMSWATATGIAYPLFGVVILITLISAGLAGHRQVAPSVWLLGIAFAVSAATDAGYTWLSVLHEYVPGTWLNVGWQAEAVVLCLAALCALRHEEGDAQVVLLSRDLALAPALIAVLVAVSFAGAQAQQAGVAALTLLAAGVAVLTLAARSVLSVADSRAVALRLDAALREQERLAVTDGLTGLYNRRFFEEVLRLEADRATREGGQLALLVVDLDHFKRVNDAHGHQSGDDVLAEAAARLQRGLRDCDVLARYGGEEFVIILPGADAETALEVAERCRLSLGGAPVRVHSGARLHLTGSFGAACLPGDAQDVDTLVRLADRALYVAKEQGRDRVVLADSTETYTTDKTGATPLAGSAALERLADIVDARLGTSEHSAAMTRWVGVLADAAGWNADTRQRAVTAARLHDIGKITLPDAVLTKPGPLDEAEWALMRCHPDEGARLLAATPGFEQIAEIVRGHHERWDGTGYPQGIPSSELADETRLVSVCDTWAAMRADRPYAPARTVADARAELNAARGTQLDPVLVDLFLDLQEANLVGRLDPTTPQLTTVMSADH